MTATRKAIDRLTPEQANRVGEWCILHRAEFDLAARAVGRREYELTGVIYEVAAVAVRKGTLGNLAPARAVRRALHRESHDYVVRRQRGGEHPVVVGLDEVVETEVGDPDPEGVLLSSEAECERADLDDDHDDRLSFVALRAAAGRQPVEFPLVARESAARQARRFRVRARDLRDSGQGDFWDDWGEAA